MSDLSPDLDLTSEQLIDAYVYVLGRYLVIRQEHTDLAEDGVDYNVLKHNPPVLAGSSSGAAPTFVNPNLDVVYSEAWIAVDADTPAVLDVPAIPPGRYYTAQIVDEWAEILHNINERNFPDHPSGRFALCLTGSDPILPDGCIRLDLPTGKAKLLARVEIGDDVNHAVALQHGFTLASTGNPTIDPAVPIEAFTNRALPGGWLFDQTLLTAALAATDLCPRASDIRPIVDQIAAYTAASPDNAAALDGLVRTVAIPGFIAHLAAFSAPVNGWGSTGDRANFGDDWGFRTTANYAGIWWNSALEALYFLLTPVSPGHWPDGNGHFTIRFAGGDDPAGHARSFWSLTLYSHPDMYIVPNSIGHFSLGRQSPITRDGDGGFTVHVGPTLPAGAPESNWLPTPAESEFTMCLRLYQPADDALHGSWSPPPLVESPDAP